MSNKFFPNLVGPWVDSLSGYDPKNNPNDGSVWYSVCSAHRDTIEPNCAACQCGRWVGNNELKEKNENN